MYRFCHRCGEEVPTAGGESPFCPHCGAPQILLSLDYQSVETATDGGSAGSPPPPRPRQVEWKTAITCAAVVAGVAALLTLGSTRVPLLSPVSSVWILSASLIAMGLYQRRLPAAWMDVGVGAKIGVVVGLCLALGLGLAITTAALVARFGLHALGGFDAWMADLVDTSQKAMQQSTPTVPPELVQLIHSPEFRAGMALGYSALVAGFLLVLSTVGGAFAGMLRMRRKTAV